MTRVSECESLKAVCERRVCVRDGGRGCVCCVCLMRIPVLITLLPRAAYKEAEERIGRARLIRRAELRARPVGQPHHKREVLLEVDVEVEAVRLDRRPTVTLRKRHLLLHGARRQLEQAQLRRPNLDEVAKSGLLERREGREGGESGEYCCSRAEVLACVPARPASYEALYAVDPCACPSMYRGISS